MRAKVVEVLEVTVPEADELVYFTKNGHRIGAVSGLQMQFGAGPRPAPVMQQAAERVQGATLWMVPDRPYAANGLGVGIVFVALAQDLETRAVRTFVSTAQFAFHDDAFKRRWQLLTPIAPATLALPPHPIVWPDEEDDE